MTAAARTAEHLDAVAALEADGRHYAVLATRSRWLGRIIRDDGSTRFAATGNTREDVVVRLAEWSRRTQ